MFAASIFAYSYTRVSNYTKDLEQESMNSGWEYTNDVVMPTT